MGTATAGVLLLWLVSLLKDTEVGQTALDFGYWVLTAYEKNRHHFQCRHLCINKTFDRGVFFGSYSTEWVYPIKKVIFQAIRKILPEEGTESNVFFPCSFGYDQDPLILECRLRATPAVWTAKRPDAVFGPEGGHVTRFVQHGNILQPIHTGG